MRPSLRAVLLGARRPLLFSRHLVAKPAYAGLARAIGHTPRR